jgi:DNA-binding MarR family transcriptional regulator
VSELARRSGIAKSHISHVIDELSRRGWVEKRADPADQRILRLYLTELAAGQMKRIRLELRQQLSSLVVGLPERRRSELVTSLHDILTALQQAKGKE